MARTDTLGNFLTDVADAIRTAEGSSETIQASDFDTRIEALSGGGGDLSEYLYTQITTNTSSTDNMHDKLIKKSFDVIVDDSVTELSYAYSYSTYDVLPRIVCNNNITTMNDVFNTCSNVVNIDLTGCNTSNVTTFNSLFQNCQKLKNIDMSTCETPSLTNAGRMFMNCIVLEKLDIRNMTLTGITNKNSMFGSNSSNYVPDNCEIIVKDQTQKDWLNTNFSRLTNVKTVEEYEAE